MKKREEQKRHRCTGCKPQKVSARSHLAHLLLLAELTRPSGVCGYHDVPGEICNRRVENKDCPLQIAPKECANCRYFVTGSPFLVGMVAQFNSAAERVHALFKRLCAVQSEIALLKMQHSVGGGVTSNRIAQLKLARKRLKQSQEDLREAARGWAATHTLINHLSETEFGSKIQN